MPMKQLFNFLIENIPANYYIRESLTEMEIQSNIMNSVGNENSQVDENKSIV